jgi:hypothetical protein
MNADEFDPSYRNANADKIQQRHKHDSRKPSVTLAALHKLKQMRAAKDLEQLMRGDFLEIIYSSGEGEAAPGGGI